MTRILGLDPGYERSALVALENGRPIEALLESNATILKRLCHGASGSVLVIEQIESYGMPVGREVFETVFWSGRFAQMWPRAVVRLPRREVKLELCKSAKANDASIRQALLDAYGPGREKAIGRKAAPGPLYGITGDLWAALAVALTYHRKLTAGAAL